MMTNRGQKLWLVLAAAVSAYLLYYLSTVFEWQRFYGLARGFPISAFSVALGIYLSISVFRTLRYRALLEIGALPFLDLLPIVLLHNFMVRIMPFWIGEAAYVVLTRRHLSVPLEDGVGTLLGARLLETLLVVSVGSLALVLMQPIGGINKAVAGGILAVVTLICLGLIFFSGALLRWIASGLDRGGDPIEGRPPSLAHRLADKLKRIAERLDRLRRPRLFLLCLGFSLFTYSSSVLFNLWLLRMIRVPGGVVVLLGVINLAMLSSFIPFSISGLGVVEGSWTLGLVAFARMPTPRAVTLSFFLHACQILCALITGGMGYAWLRLRSGRGGPVQRGEA
jgi:uncharacterized membrane protein YbhN (UPF0104 family)